MNRNLQTLICNATGASTCFHLEDIQSLWSGYGKIMRFGLKGSDWDQVVVKHVKLPDQHHHPRGWNTDLSRKRKIKSYQVESTWYQHWSQFCDHNCRVPKCYALETTADEFLMVLEDLDTSGFPIRKRTVEWVDMQACLHWLAHFHATFMAQDPNGLWKIGTYWHLDTRPDEWASLEDSALKNAAAKIDERLRMARFQTIVHGDAKLENFCFSESLVANQTVPVAAVDFQYVGGGCGMKDVAYFISSCLDETECERQEAPLLDSYFVALEDALRTRRPMIDYNAVEQEWRNLYPTAWTDFYRFLKGWCPGYWKIHRYSERLARSVVADLEDAI